MQYKISLKNSKDKTVIIDNETYNYIINNPHLKQIEFIDNLRLHSNGYAFFQKNWPREDGTYKTETIYIQKLVAEKFIDKPDTLKKYWVRFINRNKLDCRIRNLEWSTLSNVVRNTKKIENSTGYRGVTKNKNKFLAIIYQNKKRIRIGSYNTAKEAALAYNNKSVELFGETISLNKIQLDECGNYVPGKFSKNNSETIKNKPITAIIPPAILFIHQRLRNRIL